ncbi:MAG: hypothetical protein U0441_20105 [Polyangiaceae bacterium]
MGPSGKPPFDPAQFPPIDPEGGEDEATIMREAVPDDLLDQGSTADRETPVGGGSIFSNNAAPIRGALPTEEEGDALLDQLLADPGLTPEPSGAPPARATPSFPVTSEPTMPETGLFAPIDPDDESVDEPTRMLSALTIEEQERVVLDVTGQKVGSPTPAPVEEEIELPTADAPTREAAAIPEPTPIPEEPIDYAAEAEADVPVVPLAAASERPHEETPPPRALPALPSIAPPAGDFADEQDAAAHLLRTQQRDAWVARAEWLRAEAEALDDKHRRSRSLLAVSELFAMAGEEATAKQIAEETRELAPTMALAHQQVRALVVREADFRGVLDTLDAQARAVHIPAVRTHTTAVGAEVARLRIGDADAAAKRVELSIRAQAQDPRGHVQRFCEALGAPDPEPGAPAAIAKVHIPDVPQLASLVHAAAQVAAHRRTGPAPRGAAKTEAGTVYETLLRARGALAADDLEGTLAGLGKLGESAPLSGGAGWLAASLAASRKETRAEAIGALRGVASGSHGDLARRAIAAHAIEAGDAAGMAWALDDDGSGAFSAADRLVLAALSPKSDGATDVAPWMTSVLQDPELAPIAAAASASLTALEDANRQVETIGDGRARAGASLGRALTAVLGHDGTLRSHGFSDALGAYSDAASGSGVATALAIEVDIDAGFGGRVARALSEWHAEDANGERDRALAASVLAEISGEPDRAVLDLDRAREADPIHEGAVRARAAHSDADDFARILATHADNAQGPHAAVLLTEAATRLAASGADPSEIDRLLKKAIPLDPKLPIPLYLAERAARAADSVDEVSELLRTRREASTDPVEQAHDFIREAVLVGSSEPATAAALLEQALRARPKDAGLRDMLERLSPEPPPDRAAWRLARAAETTGAETARMALEAAMDYERARDPERAAAAARAAMVTQEGAAPHGDELLAAIVAYRAALEGHGAGELVDALLPQARASTDPTERLEIYERLAELDERGRSDAASGLLWRRTILEETPSHLPTLRRVASDLITTGRQEELEPIAFETARALQGGEAVAHAMLSARLRLGAGTWESTRDPVEIAYKQEPRGPWVLRQMAAHARAKGEHALAIEADRQLIERTDRPSEAATISLRAAESAAAAGDQDLAKQLLLSAVELMPEHLFAHLTLARVAESTGDLAGAAAALEAAANASATNEEKAANLYRAATLWQDRANAPATEDAEADAEQRSQNLSRARASLEAVAALDPAYADVFQRLQAIYIAEGARQELASLLEARLAAVEDPAERVELEVLRGRALADVGDPAAAKRALAAALDANPDHVEALSAFADVCATEEDWVGAEEAWIRLARLASEPAQQIAIYNKLGELYDERLPNPERAELSYQEILKREPANEGAREKLVALYKRTGDTAKALEQQTVLINNAEAPEAKCKRTTELASIYEAMGDAKKAEATLLGARKTYPKDDVALVALAGFYQRTNQAQAANVLLDRAVTDARRALGAGRFEPYLFSTLATVADIRGKADAARTATVAVAALEGNDARLEAVGGTAGDPALDELLAPEVITPAFRELLLRSGPVLDTAVPFDLGAIRATPLPPQQSDIADEVTSLAGYYGLTDVRVLVSSALGAVCVPATSHPPTIVFGQALVSSPRTEVRTFLVHRALKVLQINAGAFARTAPIDLWPLLAAFLRAYSPTFQPQGVDAGKLNDFYGRVTRALGGKPDPQLGALAADVIGTIGNRASTLGTAVNGWGNRTGFLAVGDANAALAGIAWSSGNTNAPPASGKDRLTWIGRNAEARELMVFTVSDAFAAARTRAGVGD